MAVGVYVNYQNLPTPVVANDTPATVELRAQNVLIQTLMGNGTQTLDELSRLRSDQLTPGQ